MTKQGDKMCDIQLAHVLKTPNILKSLLHIGLFTTCSSATLQALPKAPELDFNQLLCSPSKISAQLLPQMQPLSWQIQHSQGGRGTGQQRRHVVLHTGGMRQDTCRATLHGELNHMKMLEVIRIIPIP